MVLDRFASEPGRVVATSPLAARRRIASLLVIVARCGVAAGARLMLFGLASPQLCIHRRNALRER